MIGKVVAFTLALALSTEGFKQMGERAGVTVYRRHAHAIDLAAEGDISAPPEVVRKVLLDYANHTKWVHDLGESRVLEQGFHTLSVYQRLALPMIEDRDYTLQVTWGDDGDARWLRFHTTNAGPPPHKHVVRMPLHQGSWQLIPIDGGRRTHAVYRVEMELGGAMPMWLARGRACKDVPGIFEQIRNQVRYYQ
jgi:hypothetical protein